MDHKEGETMMQGPSEPETKYRILLAEDDPTNQYVFRAILTSAGYEIEIVENGLVALERVRPFQPDIILLDMMMPVMDGYEAASRLAADPLNDGIPILALTAKAMKGDREKSIESGCDDYMSKPISRQNLCGKIEEWRARQSGDWMAARRARRGSERREA